jgi:hypothetical protein
MTLVQVHYMVIDDEKKTQTPEEINAMMKLTMAGIKK